VYQSFTASDLPYDAMIMMTANFNETESTIFSFTLKDIEISLETGEKATITDLYGDSAPIDITDVNAKLSTGNLAPHASRLLKIQVYIAQEEVLFMQD
jgi:hypothetical protein